MKRAFLQYLQLLLFKSALERMSYDDYKSSSERINDYLAGEKAFLRSLRTRGIQSGGGARTGFSVCISSQLIPDVAQSGVPPANAVRN
ncbi:hypothetical protein EVAR_69426_1 [Eumeta japonica]|uniref:Uncharacterized protein n=1 Tax=Eumeta variegata TaxID=151549 RepID=A0A4C1TJY3_EUMVA|nr:hypothetical protein EVAR_69426_1 [Eumeta japonica]